MAEQSESSEESSSETSISEFKRKQDIKLVDNISTMTTSIDHVDLNSLVLDKNLMEDSPSVKKWLDWCRSHSHVRCTEADVPSFILPKNYTGILIDVKVGVKGKNTRVPDDKIYLKFEDLRQKVARGNCVLELNKLEKGKISSTTYILLVFALKKFSGGMGDEDEDHIDRSQTEWMNYFQKDVTTANKLVSTEKANGEAAHISCRKLLGTKYYCIGSKNVHLLARNLDDIGRYKDGRYDFARRIAHAFFTNYMDNPEISQEKKESFFNYSHHNQFTTVLEFLQPQYQHVVNLSYLNRPELRFICWTRPDLEDDLCGENTLCPLPVHQSLEKAREFGLTTIDYEMIQLPSNEDPMSVIEKLMDKIRGDYGYEGKVLYFLDSQNRTIGLIKKKTAWYIILRAVREKLAVLTSAKKTTPFSDLIKRIETRLKEIQGWIGFSDCYLNEWIKLSTAFAKWAYVYKQRTEIRSNFPIIFDEFLEQKDGLREEYDKLIKSFELKK